MNKRGFLSSSPGRVFHCDVWLWLWARKNGVEVWSQESTCAYVVVWVGGVGGLGIWSFYTCFLKTRGSSSLKKMELDKFMMRFHEVTTRSHLIMLVYRRISRKKVFFSRWNGLMVNKEIQMIPVCGFGIPRNIRFFWVNHNDLTVLPHWNHG